MLVSCITQPSEDPLDPGKTRIAIQVLDALAPRARLRDPRLDGTQVTARRWTC